MASTGGNSTAKADPTPDGDGSIDRGTIVALVALAISIVALIGTFAQVMQQYFASAAGYSNCDQKVIGDWHKSKRRKFRWEELRFEVQFEAPVIFVCPPGNEKGPVKEAPVWHINGTGESLQKTRIRLPSADERTGRATAEKSLHTADNEQATWVVLLQELQRMERDSRDWQGVQYHKNPPRDALCDFENHTLCVAVQAKKRTWDTMPDVIKKPYATTTMCHLVEMAAMLGIYWQEFDRSKDKYRAEGNGYALSGSHVTDLGIVFTFQICGQSHFEDNRIVPADEAKEFAFGLVSTIFRGGSDKRRLVFATEEQKDLGILRLGSTNEIAETLVSFGCNTNTSNILRSDSKKHGHLFPLAFEILGMLGQVLHVPNSCFRVVPNPTFYIWDKKYFSMRKLLKEYKNKIIDDDLVRVESTQIDHLQAAAEKIDKRLTAQRKKLGENGISLELLDALHETIDECDKYLSSTVRRKVVELVLREHIQEVLKMVNSEDGYADAVGGAAGANGTDNDSTRQRKRPTFNDLMTAPPEERQEKFMDIYFAVIMPRVVEQATQALVRLKNSTLHVPTHQPADSTSSLGSGAVPTPTPSRGPTPVDNGNPAGAGAVRENTNPATQVSPPSDEEEDAGGGGGGNGPAARPGLPRGGGGERRATEAWCTLVFRMLCWLLLHDFHRKDVQKPKSELLGSRLPVYIA